MKASILFLCFSAPCMFGQIQEQIFFAGGCGAYSVCGSVTFPAASGSGTDSNITLATTFSDSRLAVTGSGGTISSTSTRVGITVPNDMIFSSTVCTSPTAYAGWGFEKYTTTTGVGIAWVLIPSLTTGDSVTVYVCAGNSAISTYQGGTVGSEYDSNTVAAYHFPDGSTLSLLDFGANGYNLTNSSLAAGTGIVDGGISNVATNYATSPTISNMGGSLTVSLWFNRATNGNYQIAFSSVGGTYELWAANNADNHALCYWNGSGEGSTAVSASAWHSIAFTYDGANLNCDIDGVANSVATAVHPNITSFTIMDRVGSTAYPLQGNADQLTLSKAARSAGWLTTEFNNRTSPPAITIN